MSAVATATPSSASSSGAYIRAAEALRRYGSRLSRSKLYRLATLGEVRVNLPPGRAPVYHAGDLDRVMREQGA